MSIPFKIDGKKLSVCHKLLLIVLLGLSVRLYMALNAVTISFDGAWYMYHAREFSSGNLINVFNLQWPPLNSITISFFHNLFGDYEFSGRIVSFFFGTLAIFLSFFIGRLVYDERVGLITALFVSVHHYMVRYSGEVLAEGLYYFLSASVTLLIMKGVFERNVRFIFLAGVCSALAYLTKPEAIGFMALMSLWIVFYRFGELRSEWQERLKFLISAWSVFVLIAIPYVLYTYYEFGSLEVSAKMPIDVLAERALAMPFNWGNMTTAASNILKAFRMPFFLLFICGVIVRLRQGALVREYFILTVLVFFWLLYLCVLPDTRYFVKLMPLALVFSAAGFCYLYDRLKDKIGGMALPLAAVVLVGISTMSLYKGMQIKTHHVIDKEAGRWLLENHGAGSTIMGPNEAAIAAYYADADFIMLRKNKSMKAVLRRGSNNEADFMAGYVKELEKRIKNFNVKKKVLAEVASFETNKGEIFVIYKLPGGGDG
jgi:4-amino-4-deoxy-L-arabinose transferase-like glycosyltransferase